jgi:FAD binding domain
VALCPLPSSDYYQFQAQIAPDVDQEPSREVFQEIINERTERTDIVIEDVSWLSLFRANVRMVDKYRVGSAFIGGDAAHVHSPAGGQGMNTGIQDAYNLGWKLAAVLHRADASLLDSYEEERLPVAAAMLGITSRLHRQIFSDSASQTRRGEETLQLSINYRGCSLSRESGSPSLKLQAGDRAPDAPVLDESGNRLRLFDIFRGPQFVLLSLGAGSEGLTSLAEQFPNTLKVCSMVATPAAESQGVRTVVDDGSHVADAYGGDGGAFVLVRPDGYIGWTGDRVSLEGARSYLGMVV